jgi:uncharacterized protein YuzE
MKVTYDAAVDAGYVDLVTEMPAGAVARTVPVDPRDIGGMINIDLDGGGWLMWIEIVGAPVPGPGRPASGSAFMTAIRRRGGTGAGRALADSEQRPSRRQVDATVDGAPVAELRFHP